MQGLICKKCGTDKHIPYWEEEGLYICSSCSEIVGYECKGCGHIFTSNHLMFYKDAYVCKVCNRPHLGYTDWRIKKGETND